MIVRSYAVLVLLSLGSATASLSQSVPDLLQQVEVASRTLAAAPVSATDYYADDVLLLPEYQPLLRGRHDAARYLEHIYRDGGLRRYGDETTEWHEMDSVILEIGEFAGNLGDLTLRGKSFRVWRADTTRAVIVAEAFGFYSPVEEPDPLMLSGLDSTCLRYSLCYRPKRGGESARAYLSWLGHRGGDNERGRFSSS